MSRQTKNQTIIALLAACILFSGCNKENGDGYKLIRYDGLYHYTTESGEMTYYLRFYHDGTVVYNFTRSDLTAPQIDEEWLHKTSYLSIGEYEIAGDKIAFQITSTSGSVDFNGQIYKDKMILNSYSHINGNTRNNAEFLFINWEEL